MLLMFIDNCIKLLLTFNRVWALVGTSVRATTVGRLTKSLMLFRSLVNVKTPMPLRKCPELVRLAPRLIETTLLNLCTRCPVNLRRGRDGNFGQQICDIRGRDLSYRVSLSVPS